MSFWEGGGGGLLSGIGGLLGGGMNMLSSARQMAFQREMYKHRYQYTMEDMRKAGLNPILAAGAGAGSAPPGAALPFGNPLGGMAHSAKAGSEMKPGSIWEAAEELMREQAHAAGTQTQLNAAMTDLTVLRQTTEKHTGDRTRYEAALQKGLADLSAKYPEFKAAFDILKALF